MLLREDVNSERTNEEWIQSTKCKHIGMTKAAEANIFILSSSVIVNPKLIPLLRGKRIQTSYIFRNDVRLYTMK